MTTHTATIPTDMSTESAPEQPLPTFSSAEKESVGRTLKRTREDKNLSLDEAARATKIRKEFLLAIEDDKLDALPGPVFARGFIRSYAEYLTLDVQPLLTRLSRHLNDGGTEIPEVPGVPPTTALVSWPVLTAGVGAAVAVAAFLLMR